MNQTIEFDQLDDLINDAKIVGIGSTRKVYRLDDLVIKTYLHPIGYEQTLKEHEMYVELEARGLVKHIAPILFINETYAVQPFYEQLPLINHCSYDIDFETDSRMTDDLKEALQVIDHELDGFDFRDSGNYGLNDEGHLVLIDYGMTKTLYEQQWVPLAEAGKLPQIHFKQCSVCKVEKELRMYGEDDIDVRCVECGKDY